MTDDAQRACAHLPLSCMGGWCAVRDNCRHHQRDDRSHPVDRLCEPKTHDAFEPLRFARPLLEAA